MRKRAVATTASVLLSTWIVVGSWPQHAPALFTKEQLRCRRASLNTEASPRLTYLVVVPPAAREPIVWHTGDGDRIHVNGAALYRLHHRGGWDECLFLFLTDQVDVVTDASDSLSFTSGPLFVDVMPRNDGYVQCRQALRRLVLQFGRDNVKNAIAKRVIEDGQPE